MKKSIAITGQHFTFTRDEESLISLSIVRIDEGLRRKPTGWRVMVVQEVTALHKIIAHALARAEKPEPDSRQMPLPLA